VLREKELGAGAAVSVLGYRLAMLTSGAIALILADRLPWRTVYLIMAGLMAAGVAATLWAPEPEVHPPAPRTLGDAVVKPLRDFLSRPGAAEVLAFIVLFKFGDALAGQMFTPFLLHTGFSKTEIGAIQKGIGFVATITGMLFGGGLMARLGLRRSLVTFGLLQAAALLSFVALALIGKSDAALIAAISIDNVAGGMGTAAFVAFLMSQCDKRFTATQYALLSALAATPRVVLVSPAGILAEALGWPLFFFGCVLAAVPALLLLLRFPRWRGPQPVPT
jgi:PAT family beta-lactamase induction signal transducer AmpG